MCEEWNSEEQLLNWREQWANYTNLALERKQHPERVTHLSHAARGIEEQPTVHEGYVARNLEKQGIVADRCELNRQIKADNTLLRELKAMLQKLTKAAEYSVSRIAQTLETLRDKIILAEYQLIFNGRRTRDCKKSADAIRPVLAEIKTVGQQIKQKTAERKILQEEKKACGVLHPVRLHQLSGQIATLSEEIEELREQKSILMSSIYCHDNTEIKETTKRLQTIEGNLVKLAEQRERLTIMRDDGIAEFEAASAEVHPEDAAAVLDNRIDIRREHTAKLSARLRKVFGNQYDYLILRDAKDNADTAIHEKCGKISAQATHREYERQHPQRQEKPHKRKHDFEMSM